MFNIDEIEINAAFYELFETTFGDDFFEVLASLRPTKKIASLRSRQQMISLNLKKDNGEELTEEEEKLLANNPGKWKELTEEEQDELFKWKIKTSAIMKKQTPRIAYIGTKLHKREYRGSMQDYYAFLAGCDASDFLNPETIEKVWEKVHLDQSLPKSVKNA